LFNRKIKNALDFPKSSAIALLHFTEGMLLALKDILHRLTEMKVAIVLP
jgi:hypothetical protein